MLIYKILRDAEWRDLREAGETAGSPLDIADRFIHFSTGESARATAALHFNGVSGLWLLAYQADGFGDLLRWEAARGGVLFPHVYGVLPMDGLVWSAPLELGKDGVHVFPVGFGGQPK